MYMHVSSVHFSEYMCMHLLILLQKAARDWLKAFFWYLFEVWLHECALHFIV